MHIFEKVYHERVIYIIRHRMNSQSSPLSYWRCRSRFLLQNLSHINAPLRPLQSSHDNAPTFLRISGGCILLTDPSATELSHHCTSLRCKSAFPFGSSTAAFNQLMTDHSKGNCTLQAFNKSSCSPTNLTDPTYAATFEKCETKNCTTAERNGSLISFLRLTSVSLQSVY